MEFRKCKKANGQIGCCTVHKYPAQEINRILSYCLLKKTQYTADTTVHEIRQSKKEKKK